jgi:hypothetical protein
MSVAVHQWLPKETPCLREDLSGALVTNGLMKEKYRLHKERCGFFISLTWPLRYDQPIERHSSQPILNANSDERTSACDLESVRATPFSPSRRTSTARGEAATSGSFAFDLERRFLRFFCEEEAVNLRYSQEREK